MTKLCMHTSPEMVLTDSLWDWQWDWRQVVELGYLAICQ